MDMEKFRNLSFQEDRLESGIQRFSQESQTEILAALEFARKAHHGQLRDELDPFIIHPIRIANTLLYDVGTGDAELIIAGLLHDVVEDSDVTVEEITQQFGERVGKLVAALTRDENKETKREKFEKDLGGPADIRLVKACDWLDNLRSLPLHEKRDERWHRLKREGKEMYIPLAKATGNQWLVNQMRAAYASVPVE